MPWRHPAEIPAQSVREDPVTRGDALTHIESSVLFWGRGGSSGTLSLMFHFTSTPTLETCSGVGGRGFLNYGGPQCQTRTPVGVFKIKVSQFVSVLNYGHESLSVLINYQTRPSDFQRLRTPPICWLIWEMEPKLGFYFCMQILQPDYDVKKNKRQSSGPFFTPGSVLRRFAPKPWLQRVGCSQVLCFVQWEKVETRRPLLLSGLWLALLLYKDLQVFSHFKNEVKKNADFKWAAIFKKHTNLPLLANICHCLIISATAR